MFFSMSHKLYIYISHNIYIYTVLPPNKRPLNKRQNSGEPNSPIGAVM